MKNLNEYPLEIYKKINWRLKKVWRWRIKATNGRIVASSSESFSSRDNCERNAELTFVSLRAYFEDVN